MMRTRILYSFRMRLDTPHARMRGDSGRFCTEKVHRAYSSSCGKEIHDEPIP